MIKLIVLFSFIFSISSQAANISITIKGIKSVPKPAAAATALPTGNAAWTYDLNFGKDMTGAPGMWAPWISGYNSNAVAPHGISTVYTYGGDMELYLTDKNPFQTYFSESNQKAALAYKSAKYVKNVVLVIDGVMDSGEDYAPNLSKLSTVQIQQWADKTAQLYCSFDFVDGLQIDLEPARGAYLPGLVTFLGRLSSDLRQAGNNCLNPNHPAGRSLGAFMFAGNATPDVFAALGSNGYVIASGYDLSSAPAGTPSTPAAFATALANSINMLKTNAGTTGKFVVGIPAGASTHEFTQYIPLSGAIVNGYPMYSATQPSYIVQAVTTLHAMLDGNPGWIGTALWGFAAQIQYPNNSGNNFYPTMPFAQAGALQYLQNNL